jgi:hypothetical protein
MPRIKEQAPKAELAKRGFESVSIKRNATIAARASTRHASRYLSANFTARPGRGGGQVKTIEWRRRFVLIEKVVGSVRIISRKEVKEVSVDYVRVREKCGGESQDRQTAAHNAPIVLIGQGYKLENSTPSQCGSVFQHVHAAGLWQAPRVISRVDRRVHDILYFSYFASILGQHARMKKPEYRFQ